MSASQDTILRYIDDQLDAIARVPAMWGPPQCVELQVLQLLEFRSVTLRPELEKNNPRAVLDSYDEFLARRFPGAPPAPLAVLLESEQRSSELMTILGEFRRMLVRKMKPENVFAMHDVVLKLLMRPDVRIPPARSLSSYYDIFHRVLRAIVRPSGTRGRTSQGLEDAIDFGMDDVRVIPANGEPAQVILPLDQSEPAETERVTHALSEIVTVNEWAADPGRDVTELRDLLDGEGAPPRIAAQMLRLMPEQEAAVQTVELGGRLVGRSRPITIRPAYAARMLEVISHEKGRRRRFDQVGVIRAVDIDQRSMRIKSEGGSFKCWMDDPRLLERASSALGGRMRVIGQEYREPGHTVIIVYEIRP
jgi:hypothetical protein